MGCGNVKPIKQKPTNGRLDCVMNKTDVPAVDNQFSPAFELLKDIERLRRNFGYRWNELIFHSGAIVIKTPRYNSCIEGALLKFGKDQDKPLDKVFSYQMADPSIKFHGDVKPSKEMDEIKNAHNEYLRYVVTRHEELSELYKKFVPMADSFKDKAANPQLFFKDTGISASSINTKLGRVRSNITKLQRGYDVLKYMFDISQHTLTLAKEYERTLNNKEGLTVYQKKVDVAKKENFFNETTRLLYRYTKEERIPRYNDYLLIRRQDQNDAKDGEEMVLTPESPPVKKDQEFSNKPIVAHFSRQAADKDENVVPIVRGAAMMPEEKAVQLEPLETHEFKPEEPNKDEHKKALTQNITFDNNKLLDAMVEDVPIYHSVKHGLKTWNATLYKSYNLENGSVPKVITTCTDTNSYIVGCSNGSIYISNLDDNSYKSYQVHSAKINAICYIDGLATIITGASDKILAKVNLLTGTCTKLDTLDAPIKAIVYAYDGRTVYVAAGNTLHAYNMNSGRKIKVIGSHQDKITGLAYIAQEKQIITTSKDKTVKMWNENGLTNDYTWHSDPIRHLEVFNYKEHLIIATISYDKLGETPEKSKVVLYSYDANAVYKTFENDLPSTIFTYCLDNRTLVIPNKEGTFYLKHIDNDTTKELFTIQRPFTSVAYLGDGHTLILSSDDGTIDLWRSR